MLYKIIISVFLLSSSFCLGQASNFNKLDSLFNRLATSNKFMGSIAIAKGGKIIYTNTIGYQSIENKVKATKNTPYRIGSISKTFTAVLILKAVEDSLLSLDQSLSDFYPTIKNAKKITIRQLLQHRSGIQNYTNNEDYLSWNTVPKTEKEMIRIIKKGESQFKPGTQFKYSNSNYLLLSFILQNIRKKSFGKILQEEIIEPLQLQHTYLANPEKQTTSSYVFTDKWEAQPYTAVSVMLGAGGIVSTPSDLVKFSNALFEGNLVHDNSRIEMKKLVDNYGLGLFHTPFYEHKGFGHTGGVDGFTSVFTYFEDGNITYAMTSNGSAINNNDIAIAALSCVYDKPYKLPTFSNYIILDSKILNQYVGTYSSSQLPIKLIIDVKDDNTLTAQATGQPAFVLNAISETQFEFAKANVKIQFNADKNQLILNQNGMSFTFNLEE